MLDRGGGGGLVVDAHTRGPVDDGEGDVVVAQHLLRVDARADRVLQQQGGVV